MAPRRAAAPQDPYAYPGTSVLRNHLHTASQEELHSAEAETALAALVKLTAHPVRGRFDTQHVTEIHARIFQEIYDFAGSYRTIDVSKDDPTTGKRFDFPPPGENMVLLDRVLAVEIPSVEKLRSLDRAGLATKLADVMVGIHTAHPARDGNSRATREFARTLAASLGYKLNFDAVPKEQLLPALFLRTNDRTSRVLPILLERAIPNAIPDPNIRRRFETATPAPPVTRRSLEEAVTRSADATGPDTLFADGSWERHGRVQLWTPKQLLHVISTTRAAAGPGLANLPTYAVRQYGAVYDPLTNKDLFIRVDQNRTDYPPRLQTALDSYIDRSPSPPLTTRRRGPGFDSP